MTDRVNTKDRIGVNAFEKAVLKELNWLFREQPTIDVGIDATIERVINGTPTGQQIAVQIKSGLGNVKTNRDGNFDYYVTRVHYEYWLSYPIPVIIILYDDKNDVLYWNSIFKRNMPKTKGNNHKITLKKDSIISINSISELENIITIYQSKLVVDDDFDFSDGDELLNYCSDLLSCSSDSLLNCRRIVEDSDKANKNQERIMEKFMEEHPNGAEQSIVNKTLKRVKANYTLVYNIFRTRMSNELPILIETHVKSLLYTNKYIFPYLTEPDYADITGQLVENLTNEATSIFSLKDEVAQLSKSFKQTNDDFGRSYSSAQYNVSIILDDFVCELDDLAELIKLCTYTIKNTMKK